jgi:hypothetical protein
MLNRAGQKCESYLVVRPYAGAYVVRLASEPWMGMGLNDLGTSSLLLSYLRELFDEFYSF